MMDYFGTIKGGLDWLKDKDQDTLIEIEKVRGKRSNQQNKALHLWFEKLANALNDGGYTVQLVLKEKIDLDFDKYKVKELLWRPAQQTILGKKSTTELTKQKDIDLIYEHLTRHLGEKFGIFVPFPSNDDF